MTALWTRGQLKDQAKACLRNFYWQAFLVCLIAAFLGAGTNSFFSFGARRDSRSGDMKVTVGGSPNVNFSYSDQGRVKVETPLYSTSRQFQVGLGFLVFLIAMIVLCVSLVFGVLVSNVIQVGKCRYFQKKTAGICETGVGELFSGFSESYGNLVWVMFQQSLYIFLWSLLLVVPGIIKSYEYYMVPYLMAENPRLSWSEARDLSRRMMDGNKFNVFVLSQLSFIGWEILGALMCGLGYVFLAPYKEAVYAELYHTINNGLRKDMHYGL